MTKEAYNEINVVRSISKNRSISVNTVNKVVTIETETTNIGNKTWGKIEYLINYCGYILQHSKRLDKRPRRVIVEEETPDIVNIKRSKLNMANMAKDIMKRNRR